MQIAIVLYQGMTALDAIGPYEILRAIPGTEIRFVDHQPGPVVTDSGVLVLGATHSFEDTPAPDIVLLPGSSADTTTAMADQTLLKWLRQVHESTRYTVSVCSGSMILAAAGLLKGKPATSHWLAQPLLKQFGVESRPDDRIVECGKIITAAGVSAGIDLALMLTEKLCGRERAEINQLLIEYDPQPPVDAGHPSKASKAIFNQARKEMLAASMNKKNLISIPVIAWNQVLDRIRRKSLKVSPTRV